MSFLKTLTENLYFKSLDNNSGAIQQLLDTAVDEEVKEVFLGYSFLMFANKPLSAADLDQQVEEWIKSTLGFYADFDVVDAVKKVLALGLADEKEGLYSAVEPQVALDGVNDALRVLVFSR